MSIKRRYFDNVRKYINHIKRPYKFKSSSHFSEHLSSDPNLIQIGPFEKNIFLSKK